MLKSDCFVSINANSSKFVLKDNHKSSDAICDLYELMDENELWDYDSKTLFSYACEHGSFAVAKFLLTNNYVTMGADTDEAFMLACDNGHLSVVKLLFKHDIDLNNKKHTPLAAACASDQLHIVKFLLKNGANININGGVPLELASLEGNFGIVKYLVANGANVKENCALVHACSEGHLKIVKFLVEKGADVNNSVVYSGGLCRKEYGQALLSAVEQEEIQIVKYLLKNGAVVTNEIWDFVRINESPEEITALIKKAKL